jgi:F-type H+-transporting ATPase subunit epsilon
MADTTEFSGLTLQIVTPTELFVDTTVDMVTLAGAEGDFGVLPGHSPFFTALRPGIVRFEEGGMPRAYSVSGGYVEVNQRGVTVLARTCEGKDDIDVERAKRAMEAAHNRVSSIVAGDPEREAAEFELARAEIRIELAQGSHTTYGG